MISKLSKKSVSLMLVLMLIMQIVVLPTSVSMAASAQEREYIKLRIGKKAPTIFLAGDSTCEDLSEDVFPREGWGMELGQFFNADVKIVNKSKGGKSTRSFLTNWDAPSGVKDTRMDEIASESAKGDWLFVQFGHNDALNTREGVPTDATKKSDGGDYTSYRQNLERFITFANKEKLNLAFITSINVLGAMPDGELADDGIGAYRQAMREVAEENGIPLLDVGAEHKALLESFGPENARSLFMYVDEDEYPNLPSWVSREDSTHINQTGAIEVAKAVVRQIKEGAAAGSESLTELSAFINTGASTVAATPSSNGGSTGTNQSSGSGISSDSGDVSLVPGKNNAYVVFDDPIQSNHMKYIDGFEQGITADSDPLFSEKVNLEGVPARKNYAANTTYFKIDEDYYEPGDSRFMVLITYYDFGPQVGYYYFRYNAKSEDSKTITVTKPGIVPKWTTTRIFIGDADLRGAMDYGADMSLGTRTYNAWAKFEVINIDALERSGGSGSDFPVVNSVQASTLNSLGLYEPGTTRLEDKMTRIEFLEAMLLSIGESDNLAKQTPTNQYTDLTTDQAAVVALAESKGLIEKREGNTFDPNGTITVNDAIACYLRKLNIKSENNYEDAYDLAYANQLLTNDDCVMFKNNPIMRDNFVAIAYNNLMVENKSTFRPLIADMMANGTLTFEDLKATGIPEMAAYQYYNETPLPSVDMYDAINNRTYHWIDLFGSKIVKPYVSAINTNRDGSKFLFGNEQTQGMYEYDVKKQTVKFLDHADVSTFLPATVSPDNIIYYTKNGELWRYDWNTGEKSFHNGTGNSSIVHVTWDGEWATVQGSTIVGRRNMKTGQQDIMSFNLATDFTNGVPNPYSQGGNHHQINPVYPELVFFCHEGTTTYIPDRLWLANFDTGEKYNMFVQTPDKETGLTGECSGHEIWGMNGEYMYFVKYPSATVGQTGIVRLDKYGKTREYINGDHPYWHCCPSGEDTWVVADTNSGNKIVVMSTITKESFVVAQGFDFGNGTHPEQPHPTISYNAATVNWQCKNNGALGLGWEDVSDITSKEYEVERIDLNDQVQIHSIKGTKIYAEKDTFKGSDVITAAKGNKLYVDINDDIVNDTNTSAKVEITYYDVGVLPLKLVYTSAIEDVYDLANFENEAIPMNKTATKNWKTVVFDLKDANLANYGSYKTDFYLQSNFSNLIIKDIKIITEGGEEE